MSEQYTRIKFVINRLKRRALSQVKLTRFILLLLIACLFCLLLIPIFKLNSLRQTYASGSLIQTDDRTNILILGIGGDGHEAPELTDTIILVSLKRSTNQVTLLSIPRDIWVSSLKAKINAAYQLGNKAQTNGGLILAKSSISEILGIPIHYSTVFDFNTFTQIIDLVGGVEVNVKLAFEDNRYPITGKENDPCDRDPLYGCRYETIKFAPGIQHMDGITALKYIRSRHSKDLSTGTDYARSERQKEILFALQAKLTSPEIVKQPRLYIDLLNLLTQKTITDIDKKYYFDLFKLATKAQSQEIKSFALSEPDQLFHPEPSLKYENQWILLPKPTDPTSITNFVSTILD